MTGCVVAYRRESSEAGHRSASDGGWHRCSAPTETCTEDGRHPQTRPSTGSDRPLNISRPVRSPRLGSGRIRAEDPGPCVLGYHATASRRRTRRVSEGPWTVSSPEARQGVVEHPAHGHCQRGELIAWASSHTRGCPPMTWWSGVDEYDRMIGTRPTSDRPIPDSASHCLLHDGGVLAAARVWSASQPAATACRPPPARASSHRQGQEWATRIELTQGGLLGSVLGRLERQFH